MAGAAERVERTTLAAFERFLATTPEGERYELDDGRVRLMSNPTEDHEQIVSNLGAPLKLAMDARGCRTYLGGMRVQASDDLGRFDGFRSDILVRCGPHGGRTWITDPVVVVEVLSPSTMDLDRGRKLWFYKALPSVADILLVYTDQIRVEHYRRGPAEFDLEVLTSPTQRLDLATVDFRIEVAQIYFGLSIRP